MDKILHVPNTRIRTSWTFCSAEQILYDRSAQRSRAHIIIEEATYPELPRTRVRFSTEIFVGSFTQFQLMQAWYAYDRLLIRARFHEILTSSTTRTRAKDPKLVFFAWIRAPPAPAALSAMLFFCTRTARRADHTCMTQSAPGERWAKTSTKRRLRSAPRPTRQIIPHPR